MDGWDKFNTIALWMVRLAYLNLVWVLFTALGFVLFGIFPATAAMFAITRKWFVLKERDFKLFSTFWSFYRKDFLRLNGFFIVFLIVGYFLYYDITFIQLNSGKFPFLIPVIVLIGISYILTLLFFFSVFVHFKLSFFQYIKQSFLIAITSPVAVITMILTVAALYGITLLIPGIIPLFTGSVIAVCFTLISNKAFTRLEKKLNKNIQEQV